MTSMYNSTIQRTVWNLHVFLAFFLILTDWKLLKYYSMEQIHADECKWKLPQIRIEAPPQVTDELFCFHFGQTWRLSWGVLGFGLATFWKQLFVRSSSYKRTNGIGKKLQLDTCRGHAKKDSSSSQNGGTFQSSTWGWPRPHRTEVLWRAGGVRFASRHHMDELLIPCSLLTGSRWTASRGSMKLINNWLTGASAKECEARHEGAKGSIF